jgi:hypothetical protein
MRRREFVAGVGSTMAAWPFTALAQQPTNPVVRAFDNLGAGGADDDERARLFEIGRWISRQSATAGMVWSR